MRNKIIIKTIFCFSLIFLIFSTNVMAADYSISITNKTYKISEVSNKGTQSAIFYDVLITMKNEGIDFSDDITIELTDEFDIPTIQNYTFSPNELKVIIFDEYPVVGNGPHEITIRYYPTNESRTSAANTGSATMTLGEQQQNDSSTPFLPIWILLCLIIIFTLYKKRNKR